MRIPTNADGSCRNETLAHRAHALRVEAGLAARGEVEKESERAVARWEATLRAGEVDEGVRREELKAVEKLEVLLKASTAALHRPRTKATLFINTSSKHGVAGDGMFCVFMALVERGTRSFLR